MMGNWKRLGALAAAGLIALTTQVAHSAPTAPRTGARTLAAASSSGGQVKITGWATFSGVNIAAGTAKPEAATSPDNLRSADLIGAQLVYRPEMADLYMRWQVQKLASLNGAVANSVGTLGTLYVFKANIANVPVEIRAQSQGVTQLYQLWTCKSEAACTLAGNITGAFGTTGEEVIAEVTLAQLAGFGLPLKEGDTIGGPPTAGTFSGLIGSPSPSQTQLAVKTIFMAKTARVTVPAKKVSVSVGHTTQVGTLDKGYFTAYVPRSAFKRNPSPVTTKTCLGLTCVSQTFTVKY